VLDIRYEIFLVKVALSLFVHMRWQGLREVGIQLFCGNNILYYKTCLEVKVEKKNENYVKSFYG
jgi:hypothetical protein